MPNDGERKASEERGQSGSTKAYSTIKCIFCYHRLHQGQHIQLCVTLTPHMVVMLNNNSIYSLPVRMCCCCCCCWMLLLNCLHRRKSHLNIISTLFALFRIRTEERRLICSKCQRQCYLDWWACLWSRAFVPPRTAWKGLHNQSQAL